MPLWDKLFLERGVALHLNRFESSLPVYVLCHVWLKLGGNSGEEDFQMLLIEEYVDLHVSKLDSP